MAHSKSAKKRARQNAERRVKNRAVRSMLKTHIKKVREAVAAKDLVKAGEEAKVTQAKLDRAAAQGVIHRNAASRTKSRVQHLLKTSKGK